MQFDDDDEMGIGLINEDIERIQKEIEDKNRELLEAMAMLER